MSTLARLLSSAAGAVYLLFAHVPWPWRGSGETFAVDEGASPGEIEARLIELACRGLFRMVPGEAWAMTSPAVRPRVRLWVEFEGHPGGGAYTYLRVGRRDLSYAGLDLPRVREAMTSGEDPGPMERSLWDC